MCQYFTLKELVHTDTGLENIPSWTELENLKLLGSFLDFIRIEYKKPIFVNSAYRSKEVNAKVGGSSTSAHLKGLAADIRGNLMKDLWYLLIKHIGEIDQLIGYYDNNARLKWIHVGITRGTPRSQIIHKNI